jgi:hypothetical protein
LWGRCRSSRARPARPLAGRRCSARSSPCSSCSLSRGCRPRRAPASRGAQTQAPLPHLRQRCFSTVEGYFAQWGLALCQPPRSLPKHESRAALLCRLEYILPAKLLTMDRECLSSISCAP